MTATAQSSPLPPKRHGTNDVVASERANLSHRPSITSLIRDSSREASAAREKS